MTTPDFSSLDALRPIVSSGNILDLTFRGVILYLGLFWLALIIWVTKDVINRSNNIVFQTMAILLNTFLPLFGLVLYLLIRPSKTLLEKYYEELELRALSGEKNCPQCSAVIGHDFSYCPECGELVKSQCLSCKKHSLTVYTICPYCGKDKSEEVKEKNTEATKEEMKKENQKKENQKSKK